MTGLKDQGGVLAQHLQGRLKAVVATLQSTRAELAAIQREAARLSTSCKAAHEARDKAGKGYELPNGCSLAHWIEGAAAYSLEDDFPQILDTLADAATATREGLRERERKLRAERRAARARAKRADPRAVPLPEGLDKLSGCFADWSELAGRLEPLLKKARIEADLRSAVLCCLGSGKSLARAFEAIASPRTAAAA